MYVTCYVVRDTKANTCLKSFLFASITAPLIRIKKRYSRTCISNGPVLSGHPPLSGQFSKSRFCAHANAVFVTCIRRPPLLSGCGHPVAVLCLSFFVIFNCIKRPPLNGNYKATCHFLRCFIVFKMRSIITTMDTRNCRWQCRQLTTCSTNKIFKCRSAKRTCPTFLSLRNSYPITTLT